jgi:hypothetical protein
MEIAVQKQNTDTTPRQIPQALNRTDPATKAALHREVAIRYAWASRRCRGFVSRAILIIMVRLRELERLFASRYGATLPDDDAGHDELLVAANTIAGAYKDENTASRIVSWARVWAPWLPAAEAEALAARVAANPHRWTADTLAWRLRLTTVERDALGITTIGAVDMSKAERLARRKERKRVTEVGRRKAKGAVSRAAYEAASASRIKPWATLGMSRRTWYRRGNPTPPPVAREAGGTSACPPEERFMFFQPRRETVAFRKDKQYQAVATGRPEAIRGP